MISAQLFGLCGAALVGIGLHGLVSHAHLLRRILAFNVIGSGIFLLFGALGHGAAGTDPVPQAMIITGIVVALSVTALALALIVRLYEETGRTSLPEDSSDGEN